MYSSVGRKKLSKELLKGLWVTEKCCNIIEIEQKHESKLNELFFVFILRFLILF